MYPNVSDISSLCRSSCNHLYCEKCAAAIIETSLASKNEFPACIEPKCGQIFNAMKTKRVQTHRLLSQRYQIRDSDIQSYIQQYHLVHGFIRYYSKYYGLNIPIVMNDIISDYYELVYYTLVPCTNCTMNGYTKDECCNCNGNGTHIKCNHCKTCNNKGSNVYTMSCAQCIGTGYSKCTTNCLDCVRTNGYKGSVVNYQKNNGIFEKRHECIGCDSVGIKTVLQTISQKPVSSTMYQQQNCGQRQQLQAETGSNANGKRKRRRKKSNATSNTNSNNNMHSTPISNLKHKQTQRLKATHVVSRQIACVICQGSGLIDGICSSCNNSGIIKHVHKCQFCKGLKCFTKKKACQCVINGTKTVSKYYNEECSTCNGRGYIKAQCNKCIGNKYIIVLDFNKIKNKQFQCQVCFQYYTKNYIIDWSIKCHDKICIECTKRKQEKK